MNSYAWDTAILFIQKNSGDSDYSIHGSLQEKLTNTGEATDGINYDIKCNIYDMAGNCFEWTTETYKHSGQPATQRGGGGSFGYDSNYYVSTRKTANINDFIEYTSFRPLLYL